MVGVSDGDKDALIDGDGGVDVEEIDDGATDGRADDDDENTGATDGASGPDDGDCDGATDGWYNVPV